MHIVQHQLHHGKAGHHAARGHHTPWVHSVPVWQIYSIHIPTDILVTVHSTHHASSVTHHSGPSAAPRHSRPTHTPVSTVTLYGRCIAYTSPPDFHHSARYTSHITQHRELYSITARNLRPHTHFSKVTLYKRCIVYTPWQTYSSQFTSHTEYRNHIASRAEARYFFYVPQSRLDTSQ